PWRLLAPRSPLGTLRLPPGPSSSIRQPGSSASDEPTSRSAAPIAGPKAGGAGSRASSGRTGRTRPHGVRGDGGGGREGGSRDGVPAPRKTSMTPGNGDGHRTGQ